MSPRPFDRPCRAWSVRLLALVGVAACWLSAALLYALLGQPAHTFAILDARGTRGVPAVVWAGSRELVHLVLPGRTHLLVNE